MTALAEKIASVTKTINAMRTVTAKKVTKSANVVTNAIAKMIANVKRMKRDVINTTSITNMKRKMSLTT